MIRIVVRKVEMVEVVDRSPRGGGKDSEGGRQIKLPKTYNLHISPETVSKWSEDIKGWDFLPSAEGWGRLNVKIANLTRSERRHSFRHRPSFVGPFRYAHRALIPISDGRAWHHRQSSVGGTVLVDCSGSMSIAEGEIIAFLHKRPMAMVAIYEGSHGNQEGTLTIIARNNKYATEIPRFDGGNVVDGPALKWLARQEKPRIWVCDGMLTGIDDSPANPEMKVEALVTLKRAGIKQVRKLYQAETML